MVAMVLCFSCSTRSELFGVVTEQVPTHCHVPAVGIEINERYCELAATRLAQEVLDFGA